jgi:O-antigen/teichoic acid export membrane protein
MTDATLISIGLGLALGVSYGVASFYGLRRAQRKTGNDFIKAAFGGMALRLFVAVAAVAIILVFAPVDPLLFVGTFLGLYVLSLVLDTVLLHRGAPVDDEA